MRRRFQLPLLINLLFIAVGGLALGGKAALSIAPTPTPQTIVMSGATRTIVSTRRIKRVVHGKVVYRHEKVYVRVPVVVVHTDHHTIKVPAHLLPIRSAGVTMANPLVTVYIPVATTVFVPTTVVQTVTLPPETVTIPTTITVTLPFVESSPPPRD